MSQPYLFILCSQNTALHSVVVHWKGSLSMQVKCEMHCQITRVYVNLINLISCLSDYYSVSSIDTSVLLLMLILGFKFLPIVIALSVKILPSFKAHLKVTLSSQSLS